MKKNIFALLIAVSFSSFAGDMYLNCGKGTIDSMEEFVASSILRDGYGYVSFSEGVTEYSVFYENNIYLFHKTDRDVGRYITFKSYGRGPFKESDLVDGFSCHIND